MILTKLLIMKMKKKEVCINKTKNKKRNRQFMKIIKINKITNKIKLRKDNCHKTKI